MAHRRLHFDKIVYLYTDEEFKILIKRRAFAKGVSHVVRRDMHRYYALLQLEANRMQEMFDSKEWQVLLHSLKHDIPDILPAPLWQIVEYSLKHRRIKVPKGFDTRAFLSKLGALTATQQHCLLDRVEIWWGRSVKETLPTVNAFKLEE